jgi:para-nitrobenzyl esterase
MLRASFLAVTILSVLTLAGEAFAAVKEPVRLDTGLVSGMPGKSPDMRIFKGIPFAAPPVGNLRWRAPQPAAHWQGVRKADEFGPVCMQGSRGGQKVSEDCLYLNVWTAAKSAADKRPVMVWIYGGGYNGGSGSEPRYNGEALAAKGAVVVTLNYRLGLFGFFSYPELTTESDRREAANFGMMDTIAALKWVQRNIARFGGDPKRVTIFGESAGSGMVANLMASPRAKGLFERAIGESSSWDTFNIAPMVTLAAAEQQGVKFAEKMGAKSLADLRALPAQQILRNGRGIGPIVDGWWLPEDPAKIFAAGKQNDVPVLVGSNRDENFNPIPKSASDFIERARKEYGDLADTFLKLYPAGSDEQARDSAFFSGRDQMAFVMRNWARLASTTGKSKAYVYMFTHQPPVLPGARGLFAPTKHGSATHTSELAYVFETMNDNRPWTDLDRQVSDTMSSYWVNFATHGDPNGKGLPKWPALGENGNQSVMLLGDKAEVGPPPNKEQLAFFQAYYDRQTR